MGKKAKMTFQEAGRIGGHVAAAKMSKRARIARAKKAVAAREAKRRAK
jgi:hypothetical protein